VHPQLQAVIDELGTAQARLHALAAATPPSAWSRRPAPGRWSIAECVAHLNLTGAAFVPLLDRALVGAPAAPARGRFRRDLAGWLLWRMTGPPARIRVKTSAPFVPQATTAPGELVAEFDRRQAEQIALVRRADGLPLDRLRITSPFNTRVRYNVYAALTILPRHQHRHLWQAEQVWATLQRLGAGAIEAGVAADAENSNGERP
jgi:hypothetical protein